MSNTAVVSLTRRRALAAAAAALAGPGVTRTLARQDATAPAADLHGAGFYRRKVGEIEVTLVSDGGFPFSPPYPLFGANADEAQVTAALQQAFLDPKAPFGHVNTLLVHTGKDLVLIDAGCGSAFGPGTGKLLPRLALAGVKPADITAVVITHAHLDHIGGLMGPGGINDFPNAQFFLHPAEKAFWTGANPDLSKSGIPQEQHGPFIRAAAGVIAALAPRLTLIGGNNRIVDGIEAVPAPGHTPGHIALLVASGDEQLLFISDAVHHHAIVMPHPDWYVAFDTDRDLAVSARRALLDRAAADRVLVSGSHLPFPGFGHVRRQGTGFEWVPTVWEW